ncbi:MAG TPA: glucose-6-phosphate dehydrogenase assembly protein OpcA [Candidatus Limnocylindria bacterium]|nr:glucose-6-phosphate dehydrogenase assembly protein OpcA [Candidatus Limnocylindria bacterium]
MAEDMKLESTVAASLDAIRAELARTKLSASTMNFIVWIDDDARREWVLDRTALLGEKHPSFTLVLDNTGACAGEATVTTSDRDVLSHFTVQGERVLIDVSGSPTETIIEYVSALCPNTVPTVLWWTGARVESRPTFDALLPFASRLVVDSSGGARDESTVRSLAAFARQHAEVTLRDLAWLRLRPWQDMIANFFDDPQLLSELFHIRKLHIESGSEAEALYLGGWLASRLGWKATGRDAFTDQAGNIVRFERVRRGDARRILSVCLDSDSSWYHGEVTDDPHVVSVWVQGEHARDARLYTLQAVDNASLLERAVLENDAEGLFETALRSVGTLLGG